MFLYVIVYDVSIRIKNLNFRIKYSIEISIQLIRRFFNSLILRNTRWKNANGREERSKKVPLNDLYWSLLNSKVFNSISMFL